MYTSSMKTFLSKFFGPSLGIADANSYMTSHCVELLKNIYYIRKNYALE